MERLNQVSSQLKPLGVSGAGTISSVRGKAADDVVIVAAYRTPMTKSKRGGLRDTPCEIMLSQIMKGTIERSGVDPKLIGDYIVGNVLQPGSGALIHRAAQLMAGLPTESSMGAVNRMCASGVEACSIIAAKIKAGIIDIGLAGGVESMTMGDMNGMVTAEQLSDDFFEDERARNTILSMGATSDNVANKYEMKREDLDRFAVESHARASRAQKEGRFKNEIIPVNTIQKDPKTGEAKKVTVSQDDGIRAGTTYEALAKLKPAFGKGGLTTAGNSSQTTDGAAAVILARRSAAEKHKMPIIGRFIGHTVVGVPPEIMGVGPGFAVPAILQKVGLTKEEIDVYELNEAFASQALWSVRKVGLDMKKVNVNGGAIALGHPLGCTGARMMSTLLNELKRSGGTYGIISMCIGTGMGAAAVIARE